MARRSKYADTSSLGRSEIVPLRPKESSSGRHARRLYTNLRQQGPIRAWAKQFGIDLKISNEGHHWRFILGTEVAEWWPSSAKLVINRDYAAGIHAHDYEQVMEYLAREWNLTQKQNA